MTAVSTVVMALFHARQNKPVKGYQLKKIGSMSFGVGSMSILCLIENIAKKQN